jgi:hypothetical protein
MYKQGNLVTDVLSAVLAVLPSDLDKDLFRSMSNSDSDSVVIDESKSSFPIDVDDSHGVDYYTKVTMVQAFLGDRLPADAAPPHKKHKVIGSCSHRAVTETPILNFPAAENFVDVLTEARSELQGAKG